MSVIEHIEVSCIKQEDWTGTDDLKFYLNDIHVGSRDGFASGDRKDIGKTDLWGELWVDEGTVLKVEEFDFDRNDVLLEYRITSSDISSGSVRLRDQISGAAYEFTVHFVEF